MRLVLSMATSPLRQDKFRYSIQHLLGLEGLDYPGFGPGNLAFLFLALTRFRREHDHRCELVGRIGFELLDEANAVQVGHVHIADHQIDLAAVQLA